MAQKKGGLGRGLDAIFVDNASDSSQSAQKMKLTEIEPNKNQPRRNFEQSALTELADSIAAVGIIQPLIVRPLTGGGYQIVAGERRWRAAQLAGLKEVPVVIRELSDKEVAEFALIENLQREDLDPIEEAEGYKNLIKDYGMTQEQVSERVGKSRPAIANAVRLLELPDSIKKMLRDGDLTAGHARALLKLGEEDEMLQLANLAVRKSMNVRDVEKAVKSQKSGEKTDKKPGERNSMLDEIRIALEYALGRQIKVRGKENNGVLEVPFFSIEELSDMANRLAGEDN